MLTVNYYQTFMTDFAGKSLNFSFDFVCIYKTVVIVEIFYNLLLFLIHDFVLFSSSFLDIVVIKKNLTYVLDV